MAMKLKRGKKTTITATNAGWRTVCRRHAEQRATDEALDDWKAKDDKALPFNYRWEHVQIVVGLALHLADLTGADREIAEASAWLHDVCKGEPNHGVAGARAARTLLAHTDFPAAKIDAVAQAISLHVGLTRPPGVPLQPLEAAVLWDADKLSKLGVQALAYNLGCVSEALGDSKAAAEWYDDAARLDPSSEKYRRAVSDLGRRAEDAERLRKRD